MKFDLNNPRVLAMTGIMAALVLALTRPIVPTPVGYTHLGDVAIYFTAFAFGPWAGLVVGGVGTAVADLLTGTYAVFAPLSLVVHGAQGFVVGLIYRKVVALRAGRDSGIWASLIRKDLIPGLDTPLLVGVLLGLLAGGVIVVGGYFIGEALVPPLWGGYAGALGEVPFNIVQVLVGSVGGLVYFAVVGVYPRLRPAD